MLALIRIATFINCFLDLRIIKQFVDLVENCDDFLVGKKVRSSNQNEIFWYRSIFEINQTVSGFLISFVFDFGRLRRFRSVRLFN